MIYNEISFTKTTPKKHQASYYQCIICQNIFFNEDEY
ncbi:hypothetical protein SAMN05444362_108156 [Dysgonomonas macrotermitis]|uniref:Uncharacterized protein n=1 Tax=Dysgonomonas macrotermitis TaxID=1346286 RepID=A0A1M5DDE0_9BACT|nr:hypothetical protein SAMN05444362_108156 [Dysgonomonas macrotermitis]